jgi:outer membrane protein TolC
LVDLAELLAAQTALDRARFAVVDAENRLVLALGNIRFQSGTFLQTFLPREEPSP